MSLPLFLLIVTRPQKGDPLLPGFLDASGYGGTTRIPLGGGYWCDVKNSLSVAEKAFVDDCMGAKQKVDVAGQRQFAELDISASRREMVIQSLVDWNVDDPDGTVWPLDAGAKFAGRGNANPYPPGCPRRQSVERLPGPVFDVIWAKCDELDAPRSGREAADFPVPAERGDQDGDGRAAGPAAVPDGTGTVEGTGAEAGYAA